MRIEDRLRDALGADDAVEHDRAWTRIQDGVRRRRAARRARAVALSAAAAVLAAVGVASQVIDRDGDQTVEVVPADSTSSTESTVGTTTTEAGTPAEEDPGVFPGIWPFTSQEEVDAYVADPGIGMFSEPEPTALEFAREYLGMLDPQLGCCTTEDPSRGTAEIEIVPKPGAPMATTVVVERGDGHAWYVTGARTSNIEVDRPARGETVGDVLLLEGRSTAYEATVLYEVRQDDGTVLGEGYVMGGSMGEMAPFAGDATIDPPTDVAGAVIFTTESAEDGSLQEASVVRVAFGEPEERPGGLTRFSVFFHRGEELVEVGRETGRTTGVLRAALEALFAGPKPEEDGEELTSWFSEDTEDNLLGVNLREDGTAVVDLDNAGIEGASSSAGSRMLREELDATVFQFATVERIEYRLNGSCDAFWQWLQVGDCELVERP